MPTAHLYLVTAEKLNLPATAAIPADDVFETQRLECLHCADEARPLRDATTRLEDRDRPGSASSIQSVP